MRDGKMGDYEDLISSISQKLSKNRESSVEFELTDNTKDANDKEEQKDNTVKPILNKSQTFNHENLFDMIGLASTPQIK